MYYNQDWSYVNWALDLPQAEGMHINYKETIAIVLAAFRWAPQWANSYVTLYTDNVTAKSIINKGSSKNPLVMPYIRELFWLSAIYNFHLRVEYIPGSCNVVADAISRLHDNGYILLLESLVRPANYQGFYNLNFVLHASIKGLLFLHPQILKWLAYVQN
jgi:hypothetical protein